MSVRHDTNKVLVEPLRPRLFQEEFFTVFIKKKWRNYSFASITITITIIPLDT